MLYKSPSRKVFEVINYCLFTLFSLSIILPFINVLAVSFSDYRAVAAGKVGFWPVGFNWDAYTTLANNWPFLRAALNTIMLTGVNTVLCILISLAAGYALANRKIIGLNIIFIYILIPMYFSGGLIPTYLLVNNLGLNNTYGALILPSLVSIFYIIVFRNSIMQLPKELIESAEMDGAGAVRLLASIIFPLILPMVMAFTIFSAVGYWNEWFNVLLYIRDDSLWTLQYKLRDILFNAAAIDMITQQSVSTRMKVHPENMKMAALILSILPILVIYPFLQKYFMHGILVGAVKG
ncbi:carbohydrate ABC transporter permease [Paenibacillus eucommiae]|uniref:Aldouronate transport system permease protein n=1 Tax=Paenibacillus eucommiae TaxID=1355755 RepID=A0ABS4IMN3_9BACL|nr:carbohydrate ABC transporter permease [Paenibacillus eucommiae]MBP1988420.1 putative aldouronate transport system permease protein [Paenibacillus eucommiae]